MRNPMAAWILLPLVCACAEPRHEQDPSSDTPSPSAIEPTSAASRAPGPASASPAPAGQALPARFTALGTEPFWAAKVDGRQLIYSTPEDQPGRTVAIARSTHDAVVELTGVLEGVRLALTVSPGPCSDGMSDTVYPFSVRRRLGDDEQRGCAKPD